MIAPASPKVMACGPVSVYRAPACAAGLRRVSAATVAMSAASTNASLPVPGRIRASLPGRAWVSPAAVPDGVRMTLARDHLRAGELSLARIAAAVGYGSPYAFAAALRPHHRNSPRGWGGPPTTA